MADYSVYIACFIICFANRQSIIFLCAFALSEIFYYTKTDPIFDSIIIALCFAFLALALNKIKHELQMALIVYSFLYWFASIDYLLFPHETLFYVIFPYVIKAIDIYVIFKLLDLGEQGIGANTRAPSGNWI